MVLEPRPRSHTLSAPGGLGLFTCNEDVCRALQAWPLPIATFNCCSQGPIREAETGARPLQGALTQQTEEEKKGEEHLHQ